VLHVVTQYVIYTVGRRGLGLRLTLGVESFSWLGLSASSSLGDADSLNKLDDDQLSL